MEATTKQCVMCAEDIPLATKVCPYCEAKYEVRSDGYCLKCHEFREADEAGKCTVCGEAVADWKVDSRLVEQDEKTADERRSTQTKNETANGSGAEQVEKSSAAARRTTGGDGRQEGRAGARRVLMVALVIVVLCVASILGYFWMARQVASTAQQVVATVERQATAMSTETEPATATLTRAATQTPTKTPRPTATNKPPAWVADFAEPLLANLAGRKPNFTDDFSDVKNSRYYWGSDPGFTYQDGAMQITMAKSSSYVGGRAKIDAVDFILEFDLTPTEIAPGGGFHLLYRYIAEGDYYLLGFYPDGEWEIGFQDDQRFNRLAGGQTDQIVMGQTTKVIVIVSGDKMAVLLNGQPLGYAQGPSKRGEDNTFEVNGPNGDTSVEIDNIIFWDLQNLYSKTK